MAEGIFLEQIGPEEFGKLGENAVVRSEGGKLVVIKHRLYWEVLCLAIFKSDNLAGRYLCVTYNEKPLGKIFGKAANSYTNFITPGALAARHFHRKFKEIFRVESPASALEVSLCDPETEETASFALDGKLVEFEGKRWLREIIIPEGIAHMLRNASAEIVAISVTTSGQHEDGDIFPFEM